MTKLNWDRVNMENLMARRGGEYWGEERFGDSTTSAESYIATTLRSRNGVQAIPLGTVVCEFCSAVVARRNLEKHIHKVHSKLPNHRQVPQTRKRSKPVTLILNGAGLIPSKKKKKRKGRITDRESIDVLHSPNNKTLALKIFGRLSKLGLTVRVIQIARVDRSRPRFGVLTNYYSRAQTDALAGTIIEELKGLIRLEVESDPANIPRSVPLAIWIC